MENRTYGESKEKRLKRFQEGPPEEIILTLLNSISHFFNNEIKLTVKEDNYQTSLLFLGIHAVALTISEGFFDKTGIEGYKLYLEKFVDGDTQDTKFSTISELLHSWRNILAHQWLGLKGHEIGYDYKMGLGWVEKEESIFINPAIYCNQYLKAFNAGGKIWEYKKYLTGKEMEEAKSRLIKKYLNH